MTTRKTEHQQRVEAFMNLARQPVPVTPTPPDEQTRLLRASLILEECLETIAALGVEIHVDGKMLTHDKCTLLLDGPPNLIEIADGCADISVVTIGTLSACGIEDQPVLEEVDESNLQKFGPGSVRRADGKWIKPSDWKPPDLVRVLFEQGWVQL